MISSNGQIQFADGTQKKGQFAGTSANSRTGRELSKKVQFASYPPLFREGELANYYAPLQNRQESHAQ